MVRYKSQVLVNFGVDRNFVFHNCQCVFPPQSAPHGSLSNLSFLPLTNDLVVKKFSSINELQQQLNRIRYNFNKK